MIVLALAIGGGCKHEPDAPPVHQADPGPPMRADALLSEAFERAQPSGRIENLFLADVQSDGLMGPAGQLQTWFGTEAERARNDCQHDFWHASVPESRKPGGWRTPTRGICSGHPIDPPKCTVAEIWKRAIADGAPKNGLALIILDGPRPKTEYPEQWRLSIDDNPHDIHYRIEVFDDECR